MLDAVPLPLLKRGRYRGRIDVVQGVNAKFPLALNIYDFESCLCEAFRLSSSNEWRKKVMITLEFGTSPTFGAIPEKISIGNLMKAYWRWRHEVNDHLLLVVQILDIFLGQFEVLINLTTITFLSCLLHIRCWLKTNIRDCKLHACVVLSISLSNSKYLVLCVYTI